MGRSEDWTIIKGQLKAETDLAILVDVNDEKVWLPKSKIEYDDFDIGEEIEIEIPEWLADEKGLI